ncbi:MAG: hypothetical protein K0R27_4592 [Xanthobacteraceae bacterium]|jgi:hypothetical protein|nr:hypothetical protein [Xanthobacteraceae bacterium]
MSGTNGITDEMLMSYVDGELPPEDAALVGRAAGDPEIARRIEGLRRSRAATRDAFAAVLAEPPPDRLVEAILPVRRPWPAWRGPALPLAATLALVIGLGSYWLGRLSMPENLAARAGSPELASALGTQPSGTPVAIGAARLTLTGTYPVADGLCRSFALASGGETLRGVGCDHGKGWRAELLVADTIAAHGATPASGAAAELVEGFLDSAGAGAALSPAEEAERLAGRRPPPGPLR